MTPLLGCSVILMGFIIGLMREPAWAIPICVACLLVIDGMMPQKIKLDSYKTKNIIVSKIAWTIMFTITALLPWVIGRVIRTSF